MSEHDQSLEPGAIVCGHIANNGSPILRAIREEQQDPSDSGWQFLGDSGKEELIEVAQPTLRDFVKFPIGTCIVRSTSKSQWQIQE